MNENGLLSRLRTRKGLISIAVVLFALVVLPLTVYLGSRRELTENRSHASEENVRFLNNSLLRNSPQKNASGETVLAAQKRKIIMKDLAKNNPEEFLKNTLPESDRARLPEIAAALVEQRVNIAGKFVIGHSHIREISQEGSAPEENVKESVVDEPMLVVAEGTSSEKSYDLRLTINSAPLKTGSTVNVEGYALDKDLVVENVTQNSGAQSASSVKKIAVILVNFSNNKHEDYTPAEAAKLYFTNSDSVNNYWENTSNNKFSFPGSIKDVYGWYTLNNYTRQEACDTWGNPKPANDALELVKADASRRGVNFSDYDFYSFIYPTTSQTQTPACYWAARGQVGGKLTFMNGKLFFTYPSHEARMIAHEIGHNLGLEHASLIWCQNKAVDDYSNCQPKTATMAQDLEYGDQFSIMGDGYAYNPQINVSQKIDLGIIPEQNVISVPQFGEKKFEQTYTIYPSEIQTNNKQAIKIPRASSGDNFYIEYRQRIGFDSQLPSTITSGALIHISDSRGIGSGNVNKTYIVDSTPLDHGSIPDRSKYINSSLSNGRSLVDPKNFITITQINTLGNPERLTIKVSYNPPTCIRKNPSLVALPLNKTGKSGEKIKYDIKTINNNSATCPPAKYQLSGNVSPGWSVDYQSTNFSVNSGKSYQTEMNVKSPGNASGQETIKITATDRDYAQYKKTDSVTYTVSTNLTPTPIPTTRLTPSILPSLSPTPKHTPSPTPPHTLTPTPTPLPTLTPQPTLAAGQTRLAYIIGIDGVGKTLRIHLGGNNNPRHPKRDIKITLQKAAESAAYKTITQTLTFNPISQKFEGFVDMPNQSIPNGAYNFYVEGRGLLATRYPGSVNVINNQIAELISDKFYMITGNINDQGLSKNKLNILDYNVLISCSIYSQSKATCDTDPNYKTDSDLNDDGIVNEDDLTLFITELGNQEGVNPPQ